MIMSIAVGAELLAATNDGDNQKKNEIISSDRDAAIVDASTSILKFFSLGGDSAKVTGYKSGQSPTAIDIPSRVKIDGKVYNVTSIGNGAFYGCSSLKNIKIPEGVTSIGWGAFDGCSSLTSIKIPESVTSIGDWAFFGCSSLKSIKIPESVTSIGYRAFDGCNNLDVVIDNKKKNIRVGKYTFDGCKSVKYLK